MNSEPIPSQLSEEQHLNWPRQAEKENNWHEAIKRWNILRNSSPCSQTILLSLINAYIQCGQLENASELLLDSSDVISTNPLFHVYKAKIYLLKNNKDKAIDILVKARLKHPESIHTWLQSAECAIECGDIKNAEKFNSEARKRFPQNPDAFRQFANLAQLSEQWEVALERWCVFRKLFPNQPDGYTRAALAAEKLGDQKLARKLNLAQQYGDDFITNGTLSHSQKINERNRHATLGGLTELVMTKAIFNLRSETQRSYLSYLLWILEPLMYMVVYFLVFGLLLQRGGEGFIAFLLVGLIPWMWFSKAVSISSNSILGAQGLMLQVSVPTIIFPLVTIVQVTIKQIPVFLILFIFIIIQGYTLSLEWFYLIPVLLVQSLLIISIGSLTAAIIPFFRDLSQLVSTGMTFLMFLSGIFYSYEVIPEKWQNVFLLNPMAFLIKSYREILIEGMSPDLVTLGIWGSSLSVLVIIIFFAYQRFRYVFPRVVLT